MINWTSNYGKRFFQYISLDWKFTVKTDFKNQIYKRIVFC